MFIGAKKPFLLKAQEAICTEAILLEPNYVANKTLGFTLAKHRQLSQLSFIQAKITMQ